MSDQHQAGGAEASSGRTAAGSASPDPEAAPARGSSSAEASASGTSGEGSVAVPDAASIEAHLTGREPSTTGGSTTSATSSSTPAKGAKSASGEEGSSAEEGSSEAKGSSEAGSESEVETGEGGEAEASERGANETEKAGTGTPDTAASEGASATGTRSEGSARAGASGRGNGAIATVSGEGRAEGPAATATATTGSGGGSTDADGGFPGRPKKPLLAGAAMAGAVLVAVPLLVMAVSDKDEKSEKVVTSGSSDTVLDDDGSRAGAFVPESPSPKKPKPKKSKKEKAPAAVKQAPPAAPSSPTAKPKAKPRSVAKKASNLPLLNNVLIKNNTNQTCADIPGTGYQDGPVNQSVCNSTMQDNQLWDVEKKYSKDGPGGAPLFQIRNVVDDMCMDLPGYGGAAGASYVTEYPCNGTKDDNQLWWLDKQSDGRYWIRNFASNNQCLDSYEADSETRNLIIWPCNEESQNNHEWYFTPH
ncbi:RICIN domain-containing protein [Streptomyces sp. NPDC048636]|uniref:RICIN domain-containing protein n=1 Tax=Streptomyces sp. NPDC048636 TaxID=3155762 RepID=UPI003440B5A7